MTNTVQEYEFTAFCEADLLQGTNGNSIGYCDVFVMPEAATTCITVTDDDGYMSGDYRNNEQGDDHSYQTADITKADGTVVTVDNKIYAERYHILKGSDGCWYYLIEMETVNGGAPGTGDDYFTFWGAVPPAGVSLTVRGTCNIYCGVDYKCLDAGPKEDVNAGPIAEDDTASVCASDSVIVDVLSNDKDADGDALTITTVDGQAITSGATVTLSNGVEVTLTAEGKLEVDTGNVYDSLASGETESLSISYEVSDGSGGFSGANAVIEVKGKTDTLAEVEAELPQTDIDYSLTHDKGDFVLNVTGGSLDGSYDDAYCLAFFDNFEASVSSTADVTVADIDVDTNEGFTLGTGINGVSGVDNLDLINWIINQDFKSQDNGDATTTNYTDAEIQGAIWALTDGQDLIDEYGALPPFLQPPSFGGGAWVDPAAGTTDNALEIANLAIASGEGFEASAANGDLVGVYVAPQTPPEQLQPFIIAVDAFEDCAC